VRIVVLGEEELLPIETSRTPCPLDRSGRIAVPFENATFAEAKTRSVVTAILHLRKFLLDGLFCDLDSLTSCLFPDGGESSFIHRRCDEAACQADGTVNRNRFEETQAD
jgi:hypothetical protein